MTAKRARHADQRKYPHRQRRKALKDGDLPRLSQLMAESHHSMRDDFEITVPEMMRWSRLSVMLSVRKAVSGMTGGGFGSCVVALVKPEHVAPVTDAINAHHTAISGLTADIYVCRASEGAGAIR